MCVSCVCVVCVRVCAFALRIHRGRVSQIHQTAICPPWESVSRNPPSAALQEEGRGRARPGQARPGHPPLFAEVKVAWRWLLPQTRGCTAGGGERQGTPTRQGCRHTKSTGLTQHKWRPCIHTPSQPRFGSFLLVCVTSIYSFHALIVIRLTCGSKDENKRRETAAVASTASCALHPGCVFHQTLTQKRGTFQNMESNEGVSQSSMDKESGHSGCSVYYICNLYIILVVPIHHHAGNNLSSFVNANSV